MIRINIKGRVKQKKKMYEFAELVAGHLMPRVRRNVDIDISMVTHCDEGHLGLCWGDKKLVEIEIARKNGRYQLCAEDIAMALAHELVHAKQFIKGELHPSLQTWCKEDHSKTPYRRQPWEKEAYKLEKKLVKLYW